MEVYGSIWKYMEVYGSIWRYMEVYGSIWKYMEVYGSIWKYMEVLNNLNSVWNILKRNVLYRLWPCSNGAMMISSTRITVHGAQGDLELLVQELKALKGGEKWTRLGSVQDSKANPKRLQVEEFWYVFVILFHSFCVFCILLLESVVANLYYILGDYFCLNASLKVNCARVCICMDCLSIRF